MIDLEAIRERLEKATPGFWVRFPSDMLLANSPDNRMGVQSTNGMLVADCGRSEGEYASPNADLIAHAPTDIKALVEEVERLRGELREAQPKLLMERMGTP